MFAKHSDGKLLLFVKFILKMASIINLIYEYYIYGYKKMMIT